MKRIFSVVKFILKISHKIFIMLLAPYYHAKSGKTDFFNWEKLLKLKFVTLPAISAQTKYYGHYKILKKFGVSYINAIIEHGVYVTDADISLDYDLLLHQKLVSPHYIFTFSNKRKLFVEDYLHRKNKKNIKVIVLGPYIHYADNFLPENKLKDLKKKLGKILLVYPLHSIENAKYVYDPQIFVDKIKQIANDFDTVLVSCYWHDLTTGVQDYYTKAGFKIVCSGRREDPFFMSRQKDLLTLCDMVISNGMGTHVGYAVSLNKPCYIIPQKTEFVHNTNMNHPSEEKKRDFYAIANCFSQYSFEITDEQRKHIEYWWGTPLPMKEIKSKLRP